MDSGPGPVPTSRIFCGVEDAANDRRQENLRRMSPPLRGAVLGILLAFGTSPLARAQGGAVPSGVRVLKIAHQFPGGTADAGDFRDRLCRKFAAEVERRTNGTLRFEIYPENKLIR